MPIAIKMPALSPTMEEGKLARWLVKVGDTVNSGDIMAEIETDKATMEVEAVDEGKIGKIVILMSIRKMMMTNHMGTTAVATAEVVVVAAETAACEPRGNA